jgi:hypothetical protein
MAPFSKRMNPSEKGSSVRGRGPERRPTGRGRRRGSSRQAERSRGGGRRSNVRSPEDRHQRHTPQSVGVVVLIDPASALVSLGSHDRRIYQLVRNTMRSGTHAARYARLRQAPLVSPVLRASQHASGFSSPRSQPSASPVAASLCSARGTASSGVRLTLVARPRDDRAEV